MYCGLIINELVTNAYKYAFPRPGKGEIYIGFSKKENQHYEIVVSDNGIGLPGDFDIKNVSSLGLKLASILTKQLKGEIELDCAKGTTFKISFPAKF
jgi:two-component sensor histidine kinase